MAWTDDMSLVASQTMTTSSFQGQGLEATSTPSSTSTFVANTSSVILWWYGGCEDGNGLRLVGWTCVQDWSSNLTNSSEGAGEGVTSDGLSWRVLFLFLFVLVGITGNSLVCIAISVERKLQNVTNYFLMSLAVADLFVSLVVMPCCIIQEFMGYWPFGQIMCNMWQVSDVVMCTSSIMHMCTISMDRYSGIHDPLRSRHKSRSAVCMRIAAVWLTSMAIASPLVALGAVRPQEILSEAGWCAIFNAYYLIYGSLAAFFGPLLIMLVAFSLTVRLLNRQTKQLGLRRCMAGPRPKGAQLEMRLIAPLGLTTAIAGDRLEVINPPQAETVDDAERNWARKPRKSLRWNFDQQEGTKSALAELMVTNLPGDRDKDRVKERDKDRKKERDSRRRSMQKAPGSALRAMALRCQSQAVEQESREMLFHGEGGRGRAEGGVGGGGGGGGKSGLRKNSSVHRRRSSGFLHLKRFHRDLPSPPSLALRGGGTELSSVEKFSSQDAGNSSLRGEDSSPLLRRTNSRKSRNSQIVLLRLKPLRCAQRPDQGAPDQGAPDQGTPDQGTPFGSVLPSLNNTDFHPQAPKDTPTTDVKVCSPVCSTLNFNPFNPDPLQDPPPAALIPRASEGVHPSAKEKPEKPPSETLEKFSQPPKASDDRASGITDASASSQVRSRSEVFLRDLPRNRCAYRKSLCNRNDLNDATMTLLTVGSESEESDGQSPGCDHIGDSLPARETQATHPFQCTKASVSEMTNRQIQENNILGCSGNYEEQRTPRVSSPSDRETKTKQTSREELPQNFFSTSENAHPRAARTSSACGKDASGPSEQLATDEASAAARGKFKNLVQKHGAAFQIAGLLMAKREDRRKTEANTVKTERKAIKVLGTMFALFFVSWTPFFSTNLTMGLCATCHIDPLLFKVFLWLGYASSTLNPIIYTVFNRAFRTTFIRLLRCGRRCALPEFFHTRRHPLKRNEAAAEAERKLAADAVLLEPLHTPKWMSRIRKQSGGSDL